jgi:nucleoid DNA-binding protein
MTLTKERIINSIYNSTDLNRSKSTELFEAILEIIKRPSNQGRMFLSVDLVNSASKKNIKEEVEILRLAKI